HREFTITRADSGEVQGLQLKMGPNTLTMERIGPLAQALSPQKDLEPAGAQKATAVLKALADGEKVEEQKEGTTPGLRKDIQGPAPGIAGAQSVSLLASQEMA